MKNDSDFKVIVTRGSGPGGQHKNKVESCATVIHIPTGMKEKCEETRSKNKNIHLATERLLVRIEAKKKKEKDDKINVDRKEQILKGDVVRTYNYPRNEVKDHRSGKKGNLNKVMNGDLDSIK